MQFYILTASLPFDTENGGNEPGQLTLYTGNELTYIQFVCLHFFVLKIHTMQLY